MKSKHFISKYIDEFIKCLETKKGDFDLLNDDDKNFCSDIAYNFDDAKTIDSSNDIFSFHLINKLNGFIYDTLKHKKSFFIDENNGTLSTVYYELLKTEFESRYYSQYPELENNKNDNENKNEENNSPFDEIRWIKNILQYLDNQCAILKYTNDYSVEKTTKKITQIDLNMSEAMNNAKEAVKSAEKMSNEIRQAVVEASQAEKDAKEAMDNAKEAVKSAEKAEKNSQSANKSAKSTVKKVKSLTKKVNDTVENANSIIPHMLTSLGIFVSIIIAVVAVYLSDLISIDGDNIHILTPIDIIRYVVSGQIIINIIFLMLYIISRLTNKNILLRCAEFIREPTKPQSLSFSCSYCTHRDECNFYNKLQKKATYMLGINIVCSIGYIIIFNWWYIKKYIWDYFESLFGSTNNELVFPFYPTLTIVIINLFILIVLLIINSILKKSKKKKKKPKEKETQTPHPSGI